MQARGWEMETDPAKWEGCDLVFFGSDSQLITEPLGKKCCVLYFWGWQHAKMLDPQWQNEAARIIQEMAQCTKILVPGLITMYQVADFGLPSWLCLPGIDNETLDKAQGGPVEKRIVFLSRLAKHKHPETLLQAAAISQTKPSVLIMGPGHPLVKQQILDMARNLGVQVELLEPTDEEKANILSTSSLLIHPSDYEGWGMPPLEALYVGTPVACFDIPQMRWSLQEDSYYFSSEAGLAAIIDHVFENPQDALRMAARGQARIRKSLTMEQACERLEKHLSLAIREHLAQVLAKDPTRWQEAYDLDHRRNWQLGAPQQFSPEWTRHWRSTQFIKVLRDNEVQKMVDIGAGATYPTIFALAGFDVTAVDVSQEAVNQAKEIAQRHNVTDKVHAQVGRAEELPFPDDSFDGATLGEILEHVPDPTLVLREALRVVRPGGIVAATTPVGSHHHDPMHVRLFTQEMINALLKPWRNQVVSVETIAEEGMEPSCFFILLEKTNAHTKH